LLLLCLVVVVVESVTYDRCQLARDLRDRFKFPASDISQWVCLARWESNYNTSAVGSLNWDGSWDHGLFQISDAYWCSRSGPADGACWVTCDDLRSDDIYSSVICAKRIFKQHQRLTGNGFNAWVAWRQHCQGDTDSYTADCFVTKSGQPEVPEVEATSGLTPYDVFYQTILSLINPLAYV